MGSPGQTEHQSILFSFLLTLNLVTGSLTIKKLSICRGNFKVEYLMGLEQKVDEMKKPGGFAPLPLSVTGVPDNLVRSG